jgi:hypothetical protein
VRTPALLGAAALVVALMVACDGATDAGVTPTATATSGTAGPSAAGRWSGLTGECPELTSEPGREVTAVDPGKPRQKALDGTVVFKTTCDYGADRDGPNDLVLNITVLVHHQTVRGETVDMAAQKGFAASRTEAQTDRDTQVEDITGIGDEAFVLRYPARGDVMLYTRSANAEIVLGYRYPQQNPDDQAKNAEDAAARLDKVRALALDTLDDLKPV